MLPLREVHPRPRSSRISISGSLAMLPILLVVLAQSVADPIAIPQRVELKRIDLSGAPAMEVVESITEYAPGDLLPVHSHHGIEAGYVVQGAMIRKPGEEPSLLATGTPLLNLRDMSHGGWSVVGPGSLKIFTVHVVDKDKPLYESPTASAR